MARSAALERGSRPRLVGFRRYLVRRSALELAALDLLILSAVLLVVLPQALVLDPVGVRALLGLSPGLLLVARSLVMTAHVPGVVQVAQLDPDRRIVSHPLLVDARSHTAVGLVLLTLALGGLGAAAAVPAVL